MASPRIVRPGVPEEERLPWLEEADERLPPPRGGGAIRLLLVALLLLAVAGAGAWWWHQRSDGSDGGSTLIRALPGPYKVRPPEAGGMKVDGQGYASFSASEGDEPTGSIDLSAVPETPLGNPRGAPPKPGAAIEPKAAPVAEAQVAEAPEPSGPGAVIQLGAFSSQAKATAAWKGLASRFSFLGALEPLIAAATVDGGTVYRLRSVTGSPRMAAQICGRMRVAGETCLVIGG